MSAPKAPYIYIVLAGISGLLGMAIGAFGAHGLADPNAHAIVETASRYHFIHTMATIASITIFNWGGWRARFAPPFFLSGIVLFAGSLYALAWDAPRMIGAITPVGGVLLMIGWVVLMLAGLDLMRAQRTQTR